MQIHELHPKHKNKERKIVGRGGKRGTYSGKGIKGQKSRSGTELWPAIRQFIKKYPKRRGYRFKGLNTNPQILNLAILEKRFEKGDKINPEVLLKKRLIRGIKPVKILGKGILTKALIIEGCQVSNSTKTKIEKIGGKVIVKSTKPLAN